MLGGHAVWERMLDHWICFDPEPMKTRTACLLQMAALQAIGAAGCLRAVLRYKDAEKQGAA